MTEEEFIKILEKKADVKTKVESGEDLINNDYYIKGIRDGEILFARVLLELI